jgi:hypothetical protein
MEVRRQAVATPHGISLDETQNSVAHLETVDGKSVQWARSIAAELLF